MRAREYLGARPTRRPPGGDASMPVALATALFVAGAVVSLGTSYVLVTRLERIGERLGLSEALLGVGAVVAGSIALHRRVVLLGGVVGSWIAVACLVTVLGLISPAAGLIAVLAVLLPYLAVLGAGHARLQRFALARRWETWLAAAVTEEEQELEEVIHPPHGRGRDFAIAAAALVIVVA